MLINNTSTTSKRSIYPSETHNLWVVSAWESELELSNGKKYTDWTSGLGSNTLGYSKFLDEAEFRPATSLPWQIEKDFAEEFCAAMNTEAVRFFKTGSDAVSCAVRLARGFTGRQTIIAFDKCYHGTGDWFMPGLWTKGGMPAMFDSTIIEKWGEKLPIEYYAETCGIPAAIVVEPVPKAIEVPPAGWLEHLRQICDEYGIILISDEIILGFRHSLRGYLDSQGVKADLYCYGKAMAQGSALSACTGRQDIMELLANQVHFSGTNNGEPLPLQIAQWTLREYLEKDICNKLSMQGTALKTHLWGAGFDTRGLHSRFEVIFASPEAKNDCIRFCFENAILFPGFCSMAVSHTTDQMARLVDTLKRWREK